MFYRDKRLQVFCTRPFNALKMNNFKEPIYNHVLIDSGHGQPVILLHGLFGSLAMWRTTINVLRGKHRVIVPRLPLFEVPLHRANLNYLVEVLDDFLDWHQLTDVTLIGTNIGGQLALAYAHQFPLKVKRIVISGSSGLFENIPEMVVNANHDYASVKDHVEDVFYKKDIAGNTLVDKVFKTLNTQSKSLHVSMFAKASQNNKVSSFLYKLNIPVLMIWGLQDRITPPEVALHFHDLLRFGTLKFIDKCGHLPMVEQSDVYCKAVLRFLD